MEKNVNTKAIQKAFVMAYLYHDKETRNQKKVIAKTHLQVPPEGNEER